MWEWDMLRLGVCCMISTASAGAASQSLRNTNIYQVSDTLVKGFDVLISFLPLYSTAYVLNHLVVVDVASEMKHDPSYIDIRMLIHDGTKRLCGLAVCTALIQYFGFSFYWVSFLAVPLGSMEIDVVRSDFYIPRNKYHWISVLVLMFSRNVFSKMMMLLIPYYHVLLVTPYFQGFTTRSSLAARAYEKKKYIEIVCGLLANALSTYYFRFESTDLLVAFLGSAVSFLYMFATVKPSTDFGIIQFLITQSIQCAVNLFGLFHLKTLLVLSFGCLLMVFRWKVETVQLLSPRSWRGKCWRNFRTIEVQTVTLFAGQDVLLAAYENYHPFLIWGPASLLLTVFMRFIVSSGPRQKIYQSLWQWYWHSSKGNLSAPLYYYVHFKEILHLMLPYFHHSKCDLHGDPIPPV
ncbi:OLC1v1023090C1 [Oldenlandia corymbosa var. corymbosa]|uniref:OLC1v1023090C1 n=1 Tax=Oldenlandia corymbosa var. corymbosa TaxID=529605 RepID=A0AAV1C006_OLDCO|nr:OLC1v1023090C1 [Oldenlandia corymbosa var. corymbosa]